jgi:hypothetical protein
MNIRIAAPVLLVLFLVSGVCATLQADDEDRMNQRMERMKIAMEAEAKEPAEAVKLLPAPPASEAAALADLPEEPAGMLGTMYQWEEGDPIFLSTATPGEIQTFYADELAKLGYSGSMMLDEKGIPISPAFTYGCDLGAIRIVAADDAVPEKTLVAVIVVAE